MDLIRAPLTPAIALVVVATGLLVVGWYPWTTGRTEGSRLRSWSRHKRLVVGQGVGLPGALLVWLGVEGVLGQQRMVGMVVALLVWMIFGVIVPRLPELRADRERRQLRRLTPALISAIQTAKAGNDSHMQILERYVSRPSAQEVMQNVVRDALRLIEQRHVVMPFAALAVVARQRGCQELIDVADVLAHAERTGGAMEAVLTAQAATLERILRDEWTRVVRQRSMILLAIAALGLVFGILGSILWISVVGSGLFS